MTDDTPTRRRFLTVALGTTATATAGCFDLVGDAPDDDPSDDDRARTLELAFHRLDGPLRDRYVVDLAETSPAWAADAFEGTLAGESYTTQYRKPFFSSPENPVYTEREGTYYRLGSVVVDEAVATRPVLRLSAVADGTSDETPTGTAASRLPESDQRAVEIAHYAARARGNEGGIPHGLVQRDGYVYRDETAVEASALLAADGPEYVTYRDRTYAVAVTRERFHEPVYRATVDPVADSPERMEALLRAQFVDAYVVREDLSTPAREVLREARTDAYGEVHPYSDGFAEVLRALHMQALLDGNVGKDAGVDLSGRQFVRYDETYYEYRLRFVDGSVER